MSLDPALFASVPFKSATAFTDFAGTLALYHRALAEHIFRTFGQTYRLYNLGDGRGDADWLQAVQKQYEAAAGALGLAGPPDLSSFDLSQPEDHASFFFVVANETRVLSRAAGFK